MVLYELQTRIICYHPLRLTVLLLWILKTHFKPHPLIPSLFHDIPAQITSYTSPLSNITDSYLDAIICMLWHHYSRAGITMLDGFLCALGYNIPQTLICQ